MGWSKRLHTTEARVHAPERSPLNHPVWWIALALLLLNDLVLKRSSMAGAVTGKVSDFAGLIVAPVLVASIVRPKTKTARLTCLALVCLPFVAINVSTKAASLVVWAASLGGLEWRIWSDWTDLAALSVLPVAWRISQSSGAAARAGSTLSATVHRVGVVLGAFACIATSEDFSRVETAAYLINLTPEEVKVSIFRAKEPLDCGAFAADPHGMLRSEQLVFERCWTTDVSQRVVPLDQDWRIIVDRSGIPDAASPRACDLAVIRVDGMVDRAVFWNQVSKLQLDTYDLDIRDSHALQLERFGDVFVIERTPLLDVWPVDLTLPEATGTCERGL